MRSPLPLAWVERLFARFTVRYGTAWIRMWEGIDPEAVKADWAEELAGLQDRPEALTYALHYLPIDKPPTVQQFHAICNRAPEGAPPPQLPPPKASDKAVKAVRAALAGAQRAPLGWADRLRQREQALDRLTPYQRAAWRMAIDRAPTPEIAPGGFTPPPRDVLPPGMLSGRNEPINHEGTP